MKKYNVLYCDPPWKYDSNRAGRDNKHGADQNYKLTGMVGLKAMPIREITSDDSLCFMLVTVPMMRDGLELLSAWGFTYKTMITWEKTGLLGMGRWVRVQTEHILIGVKGHVKPFGHQERNIYRHKIGKHSQKPHFFRILVETLAGKSFDELYKLELFARSREGFFPDYEYEGWDVYGNEVNNSIDLGI